MNYFAYLLLGPWPGKITLLLLILGVILLLIPNLTQPIHGYKIRKILGVLIIACALFGATIMLIKGGSPISKQHSEKLQSAINKTYEGNNVFENYGKTWGALTEIDYVTLKKLLTRKRHPHFKRKQQNKS